MILRAMPTGRYNVRNGTRRSNLGTVVWALTYRDITARYRKSILGVAWALIQPLAYLLLFIFLKRIGGVSDQGVPYPLFTLAALVPWTFLSNSVVFCAPSILNNASIIKKRSIPSEIFLLASVTTALFDFFISSSILVVLMVCYRVPVGPPLLLLPLLLAIQAVLALSVGMLLASLGTYRRDFVMATPIVMQFWIFVSPVMYPLSQVPEEWRRIYLLNPAAGLIEAYRSIFLYNTLPALEPLLWSVSMTAAALLICWPFFRWMSRYFADVV